MTIILQLTMCTLLLATTATNSHISAGSMTSSTSDSLGRFPSVAGSNLEGKAFALPNDLQGELNVIVIAFKRDQQRDVDTWLPFLTSLTERHGDVRVYELPTLGRRYRLMRSFIDGGMRGGIPDPAVRAATITLYIDKTPFRNALNIASEDRIYVLLVDRQGRVHWRAEGRYEAESGDQLQHQLDGRAAASSLTASSGTMPADTHTKGW